MKTVTILGTGMFFMVSNVRDVSASKFPKGIGLDTA